MKKGTLIFLTILFFTILNAAEAKKAPEAKVEWKKLDNSISYTITFKSDYKINKQAPFKFGLLDNSKKEMAKVNWSLFKKSGEHEFTHISTKGEHFAKYWFVACRYVNNEVVSCKTFSDTMEIKK